MSIFDKGKAQEIHKRAKKQKEQQFQELDPNVSKEFLAQFEEFHGLNVRDDYALEQEFLKDQLQQMTDGRDNLRGNWDNKLPTFSPSSIDACERQLAFKILSVEQDETTFFPYQKRWVRNGSAVHGAVQKDFLYMEKYLKNPRFEMLRTKEGKLAWERNTRTVKQFEHNGVKFQIYGMVDGALWDNVRKKRIGYDFKTKSTTIATVGDFKMKAPMESNIQQMVAYGLLYDLDEYIIHYESLAKDNWTKGAEARADMRAFHVGLTQEMKTAVLDRLSNVVQQVNEDKLPNGDFTKCIFCPFKETCKTVEEGS